MDGKRMNLATLEQRIEGVENVVFGGSNKDIIYPKDFKNDFKCIDSLHNVHSKIHSVTAGKKRIPQVYNKLPDLEKYLDPFYSEELTTSDDAKKQIIIAAEEFIQSQANNLEKMEDLKCHLDSEHVRAVPSLSKKLKALSQVHLKQQDEAGELTEETRRLLAAYNAIINVVSKQFVMWDEILTRLEIASQPRKNVD